MQASNDQEHEGSVVAFPSVALGEGELERVFRLHEKRLIHYLRLRMGSFDEAEDIAQTTFLRLHARRAMLTSVNLVSLIYVTARNLATDAQRQRSRVSGSIEANGLDGDAIERVHDETVGAERTIVAQQALSLVMKIIQELPEKCRRSFIDYRFGNLEYGEIARRMGVTESMVRKYVLKATIHCARRFDELEGWE